jgi:hypothetical protein
VSVITERKEYPIYSGVPDSWLCHCKDSEIRWVDGDHPHVAIRRKGWFCMGCLTEFVMKPAPAPEKED